MGFEEAFFILSWSIYNRFVDVLVEYGLIYLPLLIIWYQGYFKYLSDDNFNSIAIISEKNIRYQVIIFAILYQLVFIPFFDQSDVHRSQINNQADNPYNDTVISRIESTVETTNTQEIKIPIVWGALEAGLNTLKDGLISNIPTSAKELRQAIINTQKTSQIKSPTLANLYSSFHQGCFIPANNKFNHMVDTGKIVTDNWFWDIFNPDIDPEEYDWPGGSFYLSPQTGKGFYLYCPPYDNTCHDGNTPNPTGLSVGYQETQGTQTITRYRYCGDVWNQQVRPKLIDEFKIPTYIDLPQSNINISIQNKTLRNKLIISDFNPLSKADDKNVFSGGVEGLINAAQAVVTFAVAAFAKFITGFINMFITTALPLFQSFLMFFIVALLPFAIILSAFRLDILIGLIMLYFAVGMLNVVWALVDFIDATLMNIIHGNTSGSSLDAISTTILSNLSLTGLILDIMITISYIIVTAFWFNMMKSVGATTMEMASTGISNLSSTTGDVMQKGIAPAKKYAKKSIG